MAKQSMSESGHRCHNLCLGGCLERVQTDQWRPGFLWESKQFWRTPAFRLGQAGRGYPRCQFDHQRHGGARTMGQRQNAEPAHLHQPGQSRWGSGREPTVLGRQVGAVVRHQFCPRRHQAQHEIGLARPAFAQNEHSGFFRSAESCRRAGQPDTAGVDIGRALSHRGAGAVRRQSGRRPSRRIRPCDSRPRCARLRPRRSGVRWRGQAPNCGQNPVRPGARCRSG